MGRAKVWIGTRSPLCPMLLRELLQRSTIRIALGLLVITSVFSLVPSSYGAPVELLSNGNFKNGLDGWTISGAAFLDGESIKIIREGSLSQRVHRSDLSFYLELSYGVRTELPSNAYFARSLVTFYVIDREGRNSHFTVIGEAHAELGNFDWRNVRLNLRELFRRDVGNHEGLQLAALRVTMELGFTVSVPPHAVACFKSISLKRVNPARIVLTQGGHNELPDRTELVVLVTNAGDVDASNLVATLIPAPEIVIISGRTAFERSALDGGASWHVSWTLCARSSGTYPVTIRVGSDQVEAELSLRVSVPGIPQITTTQTSTMTVERTAEQVVVLFVQAAFLTMVAFLIVTVILPIIQSRRGTEIVYRLRLVRIRQT